MKSKDRIVANAMDYVESGVCNFKPGDRVKYKWGGGSAGVIVGRSRCGSVKDNAWEIQFDGDPKTVTWRAEDIVRVRNAFDDRACNSYVQGDLGDRKFFVKVTGRSGMAFVWKPVFSKGEATQITDRGDLEMLKRHLEQGGFKPTVTNAFETRMGKPSVGDEVIYAGGPHKVEKDLGGGKYVLRSGSTGRSFGVTALKGLEILPAGSYANSERTACNDKGRVASVYGQMIQTVFADCKEDHTGRVEAFKRFEKTCDQALVQYWRDTGRY